MRPPILIATLASGALFLSLLLFRLPDAIGPIQFSDTPGTTLFVETEAAVVGGIVWLSTFIGVRWAPQQQRTARLAQVLALLYLIVGIALSFPIDIVGMAAGLPFNSNTRSVTQAFAVALGELLLMFAVPILLARGVAAVCGGKVGRDA